MAKDGTFPLQSPISGTEMRQLRLKLRKTAPTSGLGAHLHRRMGHSLEFREYRDYNFGEDIRSVDWAASARHGRKWDLIAKSFEAEERRTLIVMLDCRVAMRLPQSVPKLGVAAWIAQTLVAAALEEQDRVIVLPVFSGPSPGSPITINRAADIAKVQSFVADKLERSLGESDWHATPNAGLSASRGLLKPSAAVVLISDALFDDPGDEFTSFARGVQRNYRTFHMVEIDSWPHEKALLSVGPFRLQGLAGKVFDDQMSEASSAFLEEADQMLQERRSDIRRRLSGPGSIWPREALRYPDDAGFDRKAAQHWFRNALPQAKFFASLLSRAG